MAVVAISVESNGWVLAVRGTWGATTGAWSNGEASNSEWRNGGVDQFPLTPSGTPKVVLAVQDAGYDRVGGLPVANSNRPRTVVATKPLRRAFPNQAQLDETDHGDGTRTVRFALSDRIYSTTTIVSATFASGWKVGEGGGVINTVTNNSTRTVPVPIFRWANEPWPLVRGTVGTPNHTVRCEVIIASHHPEHVADVDGSRHQACAALLLRAFDGTSTKDFYFTAPQTSSLYGDNLRCWGGNIDLSGLSAGPITIHATVFPWIGSPRATGTAHSTSITAAIGPTWGGPFHCYYDPTGSDFTQYFVMVDNTSSNTDPTSSTHRAAVTLYTSLAAAQAAPLANRAGNVQVAQAKIGNDINATWTGRNGFASATRAGIYPVFVLAAGQTHTTGATFGSAGMNVGPSYLTIMGDPANVNPRANVTFQSPVAAARIGNTDRIKFRDCTIRMGASDIFQARTNSWVTTENVEINSVAGSENLGAGIYSALNNFSAFNTTMKNTLAQPFGWFMRNVQRTRANASSATACMINVTIAPAAAGDYNPGRTNQAFSAGFSNVNDLMLWGCRVYGWQASFISAQGATNFGEDTFSTRWAVVNCTFEIATDSGNKIFTAIGESGGSALRDSIFENTVIAGGRFNWHNDAPYAATSGGIAAVRVNNSPNTTITIGLMNHGLNNGDTVTIAGFLNANLNRTSVAVTVLDANRFQYTAAAAVTTITSAGLRDQMAGDAEGPRVTYTSGPNSGQTRLIVGHNNIHTNNVIRYCAMDRNATKHDTFNNDPGLTGSWELLHGVGYRGNANANRGTASPSSFQYAFYGLGSELELNFTGGVPGVSEVRSYGVNWFGYMDDLSANGPGQPAGVGSGDYRAHTITAAPYKPSRLLNKGNGPASIDRDANNTIRAFVFDGGALGRLPNSVAPSALQPSGALHLYRATMGAVRWRAPIATADAASRMSASQGRVSLVVTPVAGVSRLLEVVPDGRDLHVDPE